MDAKWLLFVDAKTPSKTTGRKDKSRPAIWKGTEQALLIRMLQHQDRATIAELVKAIRWQAYLSQGASPERSRRSSGSPSRANPAFPG
jgi:hypothetical protein